MNMIFGNSLTCLFDKKFNLRLCNIENRAKIRKSILTNIPYNRNIQLSYI